MEYQESYLEIENIINKDEADDETYFLKNADLSGGDNYKHFEYLLSLKYKRIAKKSIGFAWYHPGWEPSNVEIWISD